MINRKTYLPLATVAALALATAGCIHDDGDGDNMMLADGLSVSPSAAVYADSDQDALSDRLPDGSTTFAPISTALERDFDNVRTKRPASGFAYVESIASDGANGFHVTFVVDGSSSMVHFATADWDGSNDYFEVTDSNGNIFGLWSETGSFDDPSDRTSGHPDYEYFDAVEWHAYFKTSHTAYEGASVFGARTRPENMPTGTARYEGDVTGFSFYLDDPSIETGLATVVASLSLDVNFDNSDISGRIDEFVADPPGVRQGVALPDSTYLEVANGVIMESRFTADLIGRDTDENPNLLLSLLGYSGNVLGEFYGPNAEELGGVIEGHRAPTDNIREAHMVGSFEAEKQ